MTAQTQAEALLPCPFCGEPAEIIRHAPIFHVRCRQWACGCHGSSTFEYSTEEAIISWNRRAPAAPVQAVTTGAAVATTEAGNVIAGPAPAYRLLQRGVDTIRATDEFLDDDVVTWKPVGRGIFAGMTYIGGMLPARRAIGPRPVAT